MESKERKMMMKMKKKKIQERKEKLKLLTNMRSSVKMKVIRTKMNTNSGLQPPKQLKYVET